MKYAGRRFKQFRDEVLKSCKFAAGYTDYSLILFQNQCNPWLYLFKYAGTLRRTYLHNGDRVLCVRMLRRGSPYRDIASDSDDLHIHRVI